MVEYNKLVEVHMEEDNSSSVVVEDMHLMIEANMEEAPNMVVTLFFNFIKFLPNKSRQNFLNAKVSS